MGRTDDPQEYEHDNHGGVEMDHENQPTEMVINYNMEQPQPNLVQDQYPPPQQPNPVQYEQPQQPNPVQYPPPQQNQQPAQYPPPQQNIQMGAPPPNYPPPGLPTQYPPTRSQQPMQFPPPPSQEAHQPAVAYNQSQPIYNQYGGPQYAPSPVPQQMGANNNYNNMPQSPYKQQAASGVPMPNQFPNPMAQVGTEPWRTGLFDCMDDPQNAILTACVPCLTFGQIAEIIDNGHTTCATNGLMYGCVAALIGIPCILSCSYRTKLRSRFGLIESPAPDWITHCLCEWCALCQAYRELNMRGLDPSIGWQGNLAKSNMQQQQQMRMMPPTNQTMNY